MKTIEQLFEEIRTSEELKNDLAAAFEKKDKAAMEAFLKENGCDATLDEVKQYLTEKGAEVQKNGELSEEELEQVAGGSDVVVATIAYGFATFIGVSTATMAICSD